MKEDTIFLFDLDSTVTAEEILPTIAKKIDKEKEMKELTEKTMMGNINFRESFLSRVDILKDISVIEVAKMISKISVNKKIVEFINKNKSNCYIVTGNLDVWIIELMKKIGMENNFYCSSAIVENDKIKKVSKIISKEEIVKKFKNKRIVSIGDGSNDRNMLKYSDVAIAFGGVRDVSPVLLEVADYAIYSEEKLCEFLNRLV